MRPSGSAANSSADTATAQLVPDSERSRNVPQGTARALVAVPDLRRRSTRSGSRYGRSVADIRGTGSVARVAPDLLVVLSSGYEVARSWLANRMKGELAAITAPLDDIRPERWTPAFHDRVPRTAVGSGSDGRNLSSAGLAAGAASLRANASWRPSCQRRRKLNEPPHPSPKPPRPCRR